MSNVSVTTRRLYFFHDLSCRIQHTELGGAARGEHAVSDLYITATLSF